MLQRSSWQLSYELSTMLSIVSRLGRPEVTMEERKISVVVDVSYERVHRKLVQLALSRVLNQGNIVKLYTSP
jgi:hypothetical protein